MPLSICSRPPAGLCSGLGSPARMADCRAGRLCLCSCLALLNIEPCPHEGRRGNYLGNLVFHKKPPFSYVPLTIHTVGIVDLRSLHTYRHTVRIVHTVRIIRCAVTVMNGMNGSFT